MSGEDEGRLRVRGATHSGIDSKRILSRKRIDSNSQGEAASTIRPRGNGSVLSATRRKEGVTLGAERDFGP